MIKSISRGAVAAALAAALYAPAFAQNIEAGSDRRATDMVRAPAGVDMPSEAQIVGVLQTVDQNETEAAQTALARSKNEEVLAFARQMIVDHGEGSRKLNEVGIEPRDGEINRGLKDRSKVTSRRLNRLEGPAFDRAYMSAQVENHATVLDKIDKKFVPSAQKGELVSHLRERRPVIEAHLEHARRIKASLGTR